MGTCNCKPQKKTNTGDTLVGKCGVTSTGLHCMTTTITLPCLTLYALLKIKMIKIKVTKTTNAMQSVAYYKHYLTNSTI